MLPIHTTPTPPTEPAEESRPTLVERVADFLLGSRFLVTTLFLVLVGAVLAGVLGFRVQLTGSAPRGIYRFQDSEIQRGALVIACLPRSLALVAKERGYLFPGPCAGGVAPMLKTVVAAPGDTVTVERTGLKVNGVPIPETRVLERDSKGRPVPHPRWGEHPVAEGTVWLLSSHTLQSWDSRYFGPIPADQVLAELVEKSTAVARVLPDTPRKARTRRNSGALSSDRNAARGDPGVPAVGRGVLHKLPVAEGVFTEESWRPSP